MSGQEATFFFEGRAYFTAPKAPKVGVDYQACPGCPAYTLFDPVLKKTLGPYYFPSNGGTHVLRDGSMHTVRDGVVVPLEAARPRAGYAPHVKDLVLQMEAQKRLMFG